MDHPRGIRNVGNTCYLNTLLQCLSNCREVRSFILDYVGRKSGGQGDIDPIVHHVGEFICAMNHGGVHDPSNIIRSFHDRFRDMLYVLEQNDVNEVYMLLVDHINTVCGRKLSQRDIMHVSQEYNPQCSSLYKKAMRHWVNAHRDEYSEFNGIISGQLVSQIHCTQCGTLYHNYEIFRNIIVDISAVGSTTISGSSPPTLQDVLHHHFKDEKVPEWKCDKCGTSHPHNDKSLRHWKNPSVLVITLKRFDHKGTKIHSKIDVPYELRMNKFTIGESHQSPYELVGAACHYGSQHNGHYVALVKKENDVWYEIDDQTSRMFIEKKHVSEIIRSSYMLFYHRMS